MMSDLYTMDGLALTGWFRAVVRSSTWKRHSNTRTGPRGLRTCEIKEEIPGPILDLRHFPINPDLHYQVIVSYVLAISLSLTAPPSGIIPENTSG